MDTFNISPFWMEKLSSFKDKTYNNEEMSRKMDYVFSPDEHKNTKLRVLEACPIAAYYRLTMPAIPLRNNAAELVARA
ncbi:MAG: hypothetical protein ACYDEF_16440 [Methanosarcina sp.]